MSSVIKLNKAKNIRALVPGIEGDLESDWHIETEEEMFKKRLAAEYQKGFDEGYRQAKEELEKEFTDQLITKAEGFYNILSEVENKTIEYEESFSRIVIEVSRMIAEKVLGYELSKKTIIEKTLSKSISKVLGGNEIHIKLNPTDYEMLQESGKSNFSVNNFSKIKFETNDQIEIGGCIIETEIGNIDARISSQLDEIVNLLESNIKNGKDE